MTSFRFIEIRYCFMKNGALLIWFETVNHLMGETPLYRKNILFIAMQHCPK